MMDYQIISAAGESMVDACNTLEERVKFSLSYGWKPQGGICITAFGSALYYVCQAMIRVSLEEKN